MRTILIIILIFVCSLGASCQNEETVFTVVKRKRLTISPEPVGMIPKRDYTYKLGDVPPHSNIEFYFEAGPVILTDSNTIKVRVTQKIWYSMNLLQNDTMTYVSTNTGWFRTKNYCPKLTVILHDSVDRATDTLVRNICIVQVNEKGDSPKWPKKFPNWKVREDLNKQSLKKPD